MEDLLFENARIFDGVTPEVRPGSLLAHNGRIAEISDARIASGTARRIDLKGRTLMPGLIDAHVHAYFPDVDPLKTDRMPITLVAHHARRMLESSLARGFTSVRDCGGADYGLFLAVERGWVKGPRLFYCGKALSQTGGHGDKRHPSEVDLCACGSGHDPSTGFKGHRTWVVDGADNLRSAVREELRHGAHFIKIMGSGGVASPSDPIQLAQYSAEEIRAVVDEASRHDTYVTAHVHPDGAMRRCIELGVSCIEHGTLVSDETAALAASKNVAIVPTLSVIKALTQYGPALGFPSKSLAKLAQIEPLAIGAVERLKRAGVRIGFGTDLIGELERHQCLEFSLRREVLSPFEILASATSVNAEIIRQGGFLGRIAPGYAADLIVVDGDPLEDVSLFTEDGRKILVVVKSGEIMKMTGP